MPCIPVRSDAKSPKRTIGDTLTRKMVHCRRKHCATNDPSVENIWTVYSMGLRLEEARNLQVGDIDGQRGLVHIHRGKGAKDRYVPLPTSTLHWLRKRTRPEWLATPPARAAEHMNTTAT